MSLRRKKWKQFYGSPTNCAIMCFYFALFFTYFVHNVSATVSYSKKELLDIRTVITHLGSDKYFFFNKQDAQDILQRPERAKIPRYLQEEATQVLRTKSRMPGQDLKKASVKAAVNAKAIGQ